MIPKGERVYAIGDVHGRLDLLTRLMGRIDADEARRPRLRTTIILLGDLVDRGPDSAGIIAALREWRKTRRIRILCGNHEEMFLRAFNDPAVVGPFLLYGGHETLLSYGVEGESLRDADPADVQALMRRAVPMDDVAFLNGLENSIVIGDYLFVHAGIRPGVPLDGQRTGDLRWIREPFLSHPADHGFVVVHGHTIVDEPEVRDNRIGIDTGAYMSGRLTAVALEGTERWLVQVGPEG
jgi:serine/threonine protein phosphatase 1